MVIAGVQASYGLRYVIMLRPRLQVSRICCAGVRFNLVSEIRLFTLDYGNVIRRFLSPGPRIAGNGLASVIIRQERVYPYTLSCQLVRA